MSDSEDDTVRRSKDNTYHSQKVFFGNNDPQQAESVADVPMSQSSAVTGAPIIQISSSSQIVVNARPPPVKKDSAADVTMQDEEAK